MARDTRVIKSGIIFLPVSITYPRYKFVVGGEDVTDYVIFAEVNLVATERLSYARITLDNDKGRFNGNWNPTGESTDVSIYFDYANKSNFTTHTPTNQIYQGKLDNVKPGLTAQGWVIELSSRDRPELADSLMTIEFNSQTITSALKSVIDSLNTKLDDTIISYSATSIEDTATLTSANYRGMRPIDILNDLCQRADFDSRIGTDGIFTAFTSGTKRNLREAIVTGENLISCPPIGEDGTEIKNFVKGYGPDKEGCLIIATKKSITFKPWRKDLIVNDTAINNRDQIVDRVEKEYNNKYDSEKRGSIICLGMPYLLPGDSINTFIPYVIEGEFIAKQVSHVISMAGSETRIVINEYERGGIEIIKDNQRDILEKSTFNNPNDMDGSYHFTFEDESNIFNHSNTELSNGKLIISSGSDSGIMTTDALTTSDTITAVELRVNGNDDTDECTYEVSADNGDNYESITPGLKGEPGVQLNLTNTGTKLRIKVNMVSTPTLTNPTLESCVLLYK